MNTEETRQKLLDEINARLNKRLSCKELRELCEAWERLTAHDVMQEILHANPAMAGFDLGDIQEGAILTEYRYEWRG